MDSLIQRLKQKSLSFYLLFALVSKKILMSSTISLRYFLHHFFFHYCTDCHLNSFRMWSCDKWITNTPTSPSQRLPKTLRRGAALPQTRLWRRAAVEPPVLRGLPLHRLPLPALPPPARPGAALIPPAHLRQPQALSLYSCTWGKVRWVIVKRCRMGWRCN